MITMIIMVAGMVVNGEIRFVGIVLILFFAITLTNNLQSPVIVNGTVQTEFYLKSMSMKSLFKNGALALSLLLMLTFLLIYITAHHILTVGFYENSGDPLSGIPGQDISVYETLQKWIYISSAIYLLVKLGVITLILHTALYLNNQDVSIDKIFRVTVLAEFIFLIPATVKIISFPYTFPQGTLLDWHKYYILSLLSLFENTPADWYYALQTFNLFEIGYWFLLAYGISKISTLNYDRSLRIVTIGYVPALVIWVAAVSFFTLVMFPSTG